MLSIDDDHSFQTINFYRCNFLPRPSVHTAPSPFSNSPWPAKPSRSPSPPTPRCLVPPVFRRALLPTRNCFCKRRRRGVAVTVSPSGSRSGSERSLSDKHSRGLLLLFLLSFRAFLFLGGPSVGRGRRVSELMIVNIQHIFNHNYTHT